MFTKRMCATLVCAATAAISPASHAQQYTTDWLANTYGTLAAHVGNGARSMWVAPEGVIYTSSFWDENEGGVAIYQNGKSSARSASMTNSRAARSPATPPICSSRSVNTSNGSGTVGRYNRASGQRDLTFNVSVWNALSRVDAITGLATAGTLLYASDFYGNRVRVYTTDGAWQRDISIANPGALALDNAGNVWVAQRARAWSPQFSPAGAQLQHDPDGGGRGPPRSISMRRPGS
jgi:hypothetical protein